MAGPAALIPLAVAFAKSQATKFLAKRAALKIGPKIVNQKKLKPDSGTFKRATKDNLYETSLVRGRLRGITGKTVTKKITHAEQAAVKKELAASRNVGLATAAVLIGGMTTKQNKINKRKENRKRGNQIAHKKYLRD